jgi:hypothetical protein
MESRDTEILSARESFFGWNFIRIVEKCFPIDEQVLARTYNAYFSLNA